MQRFTQHSLQFWQERVDDDPCKYNMLQLAIAMARCSAGPDYLDSEMMEQAEGLLLTALEMEHEVCANMCTKPVLCA